MSRTELRSGREGAPWVALFLTPLLLLSAAVSAAPPETISFQALLDSAGTPLSGAHDLTFAIYDTSAAGAAIWTETHPGVVILEGVGTVLLGGITSLAGVPFDKALWLGVSVGAGPELSPRTALASAPYAFVAGDVAGGRVKSVNGLQGDVRIVAGNNIVVNAAGDSIEIASAGAQSDGDWMIAGNDMSSVPAGNVGVGTGSPAAKLDVQGTGVGGLGLQVNDDLYVNGVNGFVGIGRTTAVTGADRFALRTPAGTGGYGGMYIDTDGAAAYPFYGYATGGIARAWTYYDGGTAKWHLYNIGNRLTVQSNGYVGVGTDSPVERLDVNGNVGAAALSRIGEHPSYGNLYSGFWRDGLDYALLAGSSGTFVNSPAGGGVYNSVGASTKFWMADGVGDASANFLTGAVTRTEIGDEPGVASNTLGVSSIVLGGGVEVLLSRSIVVPNSGYVLVIASAFAYAAHTNGTPSSAIFGVSDASSSFPANQDVDFYFSSTASSGTRYLPITVHGLFYVPSAGTYTYYFLANETGGYIGAGDLQLTVVYFPTAYGTVLATLTDGSGRTIEEGEERGAMTEAEIAAERAESKAANDARIAGEIDDMQRRLSELESLLAREDE